jgi:hypothetical protein
LWGIGSRKEGTRGLVLATLLLACVLVTEWSQNVSLEILPFIVWATIANWDLVWLSSRRIFSVSKRNEHPLPFTPTELGQRNAALEKCHVPAWAIPQLDREIIWVGRFWC